MPARHSRLLLSFPLMNLSSLFSFRTDISGHRYGWTPLHRACITNREEIALFLINEEKERVSAAEGQRQLRQRQHAQPGRAGRRGGWREGTPSYNMKSSSGRSPVFWTSSEKIVEEMVKLPDLELANGKGRQLLERGEEGWV